LVDQHGEFSLQNTIESGTRTFSIQYKQAVVFAAVYPAETSYDVNPFWPTDEEDVDPFLWLFNVFSSADRIKVILENHSCSEAA